MGSFLKPGATSVRPICHSHIHESTHFILFALLKVHPPFFPRLACGPPETHVPRGAAPADPLSVGFGTTYSKKQQINERMTTFPASTLRIHNVAVWLLFGQVHFLRENYVATTYFRYVICKSL